MPEKVYKTNKKYQCPYCDAKLNRNDLIHHIQKKHESMIPQGYSANRVVYEVVNQRDHGTCMICKKDTHTWNEKVCRYDNLCDNPKCREEVRRIALERHIRVYNKPTLLDDPNHQEKMLARRRISNTYKWSDGGEATYTGQNEKKTLEFLDKAIGFDSSEVQTPGPILEYEYNGEKHYWITDIYIIPANLIIEVKDGGNNPNKRSMPEYRAKQVAKEDMITKLGTFHYLRLTNNEFDQLLDILADIKMGIINDEEPLKPRVKIHEFNTANNAIVGFNQPDAVYVVPYGLKNTFTDNIDFPITGIGYMTDDDDSVRLCEKKAKKRKSDKKTLSLLNTRIIRVKTDQAKQFMSLLDSTDMEDSYKESIKLLSEIMSTPIRTIEDIVLSENATIVDSSVYDKIRKDIYTEGMSLIGQ